MALEIRLIAFFSGMAMFCRNHPGILLVIIGVAGEVICDWSKEKGIRGRLMKFFGVFLVAGLLLEIGEAVKTDQQVAQLTQTNLVLRSNVVGLEFKLIQTVSNMTRINPLNLPISTITAHIRVRVKGRANLELAPWGAPYVARMFFCNELLEGNTPSPGAGFPPLNADRFEVIKSEQFIMPSVPDFHEYEIQFDHADALDQIFTVGHEKPAKAMADVKMIWTVLKFLPRGSEILQGTLVITINSTTRFLFKIPEQKDLNLQPTNVPAVYMIAPTRLCHDI
jgi:hypothetical protein